MSETRRYIREYVYIRIIMRATGLILCRARAHLVSFNISLPFSCVQEIDGKSSHGISKIKEKSERKKKKNSTNESDSFKKRLSFNLAIINITHAYRMRSYIKRSIAASLIDWCRRQCSRWRYMHSLDRLRGLIVSIWNNNQFNCVAR